MQTLDTLIRQLEKGRKIHISILDLSGMLDTALTRLEFKNIIHSKPFCDIAKSTPRGYEACLCCKEMANKKGIEGKKPFSGHCVYGLYEVSYPVLEDGAVAAIVYVGNGIEDEGRTREIIKATCRHTGVDAERLYGELSECEGLRSPEELFEVAEIVADYMKLLYSKAPRETRELHWLVSILLQYAEKMYTGELSLKEIAATYNKNERYIGRLFKEQVGKSFCEYYTALRLERAESLLLGSGKKIIDISLECGFGDVSYFNRVFSQKHGMSPSAYRRERGV